MGYIEYADTGAPVGVYSEFYASDFYASDVASIAASGSHTTDSAEHYAIAGDTGRITVWATGGNASADGTVTFSFACIGQPDGTYPTVADFTISVDLNGTTKAVKSEAVDMTGIYKIKCVQIDNGDASYTATNVNAEIAYYYRGG